MAAGVAAKAAQSARTKAPIRRASSGKRFLPPRRSPPCRSRALRERLGRSLGLDHIRKYSVERSGWAPVEQVANLRDVRDAPSHVLEPDLIGLLVGDQANLR